MTDEEIIDAAIELLGGEESDFLLAGDTGIGSAPIVRIKCQHESCEWGYSIGQQELWEFIADARLHWEEKHSGS